MKSRQKLILLILILAAFSLACGLLGGGEEEAAEPAAPAETSAENTDDKDDNGEDNVQNKVLQVGGGLTAPKVEITESEDDQDTEEAALDTTAIRTAFDTFTSYRWKMRVEFDGMNDEGSAEQGTVEMTLEAIKEPAAFHMQMSLAGSAADEFGGSAVIDTYAVDGTAYVKEPGGDTWISIPADGFVDSFFSEGFLDPDELLDLPQNARRKVTPEEVNGILTWHYTFTEADLPDDDGAVTSATGNLWIAQDGGYPVKMELEATGFEPKARSVPLSSGNLKMSYELSDVNADFTIELPDAALNAESMGDFEIPQTENVNPADLPYPIMDDATIEFAMEGMVNYTSASSIQAVTEFYQKELANEGWTSDETSSFITDEASMLSFQKDDQSISLIIAQEEDGSTSVIVSSE